MADKIIVKSVADLACDAEDMMGNTIIDVYGRKPPEYGVYRTQERVMIAFADSTEKAADQRRKLARLNPLRGQINGLIDGWRGPRRHGPDGDARLSFGKRMWKLLRNEEANRRRAMRFDRRVGDALVVALEEDVVGAEGLLDAIRQDVYDVRVARGRVEYLFAALATVGAMLLLTWWWTGRLVCPVVDPRASPAGLAQAIWHCAAAGGFGAFFSIALAIRGRTVLPNFERVSNVMDAALRVVIGVIGAAVFMGLMYSQLVTIQLFDKQINELNWVTILVVGFIAGFSERLVPDLLEKAAPVTPTGRIVFVPPPPPPPPAPADGGAKGGAGTDPKADVDPLPAEAGDDCCGAGLDLPDDLVMPDDQLPAASGGVAKPAS